MGSSHSSEPSQPLAETDVEVVEEVVEEEDLEDPVVDFLEHSIRWMFGIA